MPQDISGNLRRLRLTVHSAKGLVSSDVTGVSDPYCIVVPVLHDGTEVCLGILARFYLFCAFAGYARVYPVISLFFISYILKLKSVSFFLFGMTHDDTIMRNGIFITPC